MSELLKKILKNSPTKYASVLSESVMFKDKDIIPTDVPIINVAFSGSLDGGISSGLTLFAGPSKTFKSNLALICVRSFLNKYKDAICIFYDSEGGITPEYLESLQVDSKRVVHVPIEHIEMLKFDIVKQLQELDRKDKVIIVIDSIGNTASLKELEDAQNEKSVAEMQRAKSIKGLFRMVTPSLVAKDIPCITICHSYSEMCVAPDTKIIMADGTVGRIDSVKIGDFVDTIEGPKEVEYVWTSEELAKVQNDSGMYELTFEDGLVIKCTGDHKFKLDGKDEWIQAQELSLATHIQVNMRN